MIPLVKISEMIVTHSETNVAHLLFLDKQFWSSAWGLSLRTKRDRMLVYLFVRLGVTRISVNSMLSLWYPIAQEGSNTIPW